MNCKKVERITIQAEKERKAFQINHKAWFI